MIRWRRALLLLPALAACFPYAPRWTIAEARRHPVHEPTQPWPPAEEDSAQGTSADRQEEPMPDEEAAPRPGGPEGTAARRRIVERAERYLGRAFSGDCSGFVRRVMREAEVELGPLPSATSMSESLHLVSRAVREPRAGDLVFFHDTYDRNRDGKLGDLWTHVALVEAVEGDQVWILHRGGKGIVRLRMNLAHPHDEAENDPVRLKRRDDPPGTQYLTAELFAGFGAVVE